MSKHIINHRIQKLFTILCLLWLTLPNPESRASSEAKAFPWIVSATQAKKWHKEGALFVDVRKARAHRKRHISDAVHTTWQHFSSRKLPQIGRLLGSDAKLQRRLRALGVSAHRPVIVYGDPLGGWGEEGRIVWTLRSLGHHKVAFVDGGFQALINARVPTTKKPTTPKPGRFVVKRNRRWTIQRQGLRKLLKASKERSRFHLIDARSKREYKGATPYGESRSGHLPGAAHLHYKDLLDKQGKLRPKRQLLRMLGAAKIKRSRTNIAYCTGGVRSAWLVVVLLSLGYPHAKNFPGSMWEWSAQPAATHPLTR